MTDAERRPVTPESKSEVEVPSQIQEALNKHKAYVEGGKSDRVLLAQALSELIGYTPAGEAMTPINRVSFVHKRQLLLNVEKDRGGDWTQASLGVFALELEADRYPSVAQQIKDLVSDAVIVAQEGWQRNG